MNKNTLIFIGFLFLFSCKTTQKKGEYSQGKGLFQLFVEEEGREGFYSEKQGVYAQKGMVASAHVLASQAGIEVLKKGGNAVDAAVTTFFTLAVVHPSAGNLGGGGFAIVRETDGTNHALDFREKAPAESHTNMYLNENGEVVHGLSLIGHLASGVPGAVAGMKKMHEKLGLKPWDVLLQAAIDFADEGVVLTIGEANGMNYSKRAFQQVNGKENSYFVRTDDQNWQQGDLFLQKDLAETLKRIQENGTSGFYEGLTADLISEEMQKGGGIISRTDLKNYKAIWRKPIQKTYKNLNIVSMPAPSSGGLALVQLMRFMEPLPIKEWGWNSGHTAQVMIEAERRVYADRASWMGDADFIKIPNTELMSYPYLQERWADFDESHATDSKDIKGGEVPYYESNETTHFSVVDKNGMAVSITTTLNGGYGSKVVINGAGFLMNNEMDDFSMKPGVPNMFGLVGGKANEIQPGKRMLSSMTPTIVEKDNELYMVLGTPGGSTIITSVFQTLLNVAEHEMSMQQAVNAKKFHHQWLPDKTFMETNALDLDALQELLNKGYVIEAQSRTLGRMDCILVHPNGTLEGASDPRGESTSVGY